MNKKRKILIFLIYFIIFLAFVSRIFEIESDYTIIRSYICLCFSYIICIGLFIYNIFKNKIYIFEPYTIVSILYILIMIFRPMIDIYNQEYYVHGKYVMDGCVKGTLIFIISYIFFNLGYFIKGKKNKKTKEIRKINLDKFKNDYTKQLRTVLIIIWIIGFTFAILFYLSSGNNPINSISLGLLGKSEQINSTLNSNMKFLMKLAFIMIIPWIYIIRFEKSIILKFLTTIFMFLHFFAIGSRYIIVVAIIGAFLLPYISEKKSFSFKKGIIIFFIFLVLAGIIAYTRKSIREGEGVNLEGFEIEDVFSVFDSDLTVYKAYYCAVTGIPSLMPYQMGKGLIVYPIVSFLPRVIFPMKEVFDNGSKIVEIVVNERAMLSGIAYVNLGQFYAEFGYIGCVICMYIFGIICRKIKTLMNSGNINDLILYSLLFPFLMQIVTRGDLAQQLNSLLGIVIPYIVIKIFFKRRRIIYE